MKTNDCTYDAYSEQSKITLWLRTGSQQPIKPTYQRSTELYAKSKNHQVKPGRGGLLYVDTQQLNSMKKLAPAEFAGTYDAETYCELLLNVAGSILSVFVFGLPRTQLGFQRKIRNSLDELRSEITKEVLLELRTFNPNRRSRGHCRA
jgi:hypothetical protein